MEVDGVDYHFVSPARFNEMVAHDELLEYAEVRRQLLRDAPRLGRRAARVRG